MISAYRRPPSQHGQAGRLLRSLTYSPGTLSPPTPDSSSRWIESSNPSQHKSTRYVLGSHLPATRAGRQLIALSKTRSFLEDDLVVYCNCKSRELRERPSRKRSCPKNGIKTAVHAYWRRFKMQSTSEGSRALGLMEAIWVVELWLSGAGEIGISFLSAPVVCVRWLRRSLNVGDCHLGIHGLLAWTCDAMVEE